MADLPSRFSAAFAALLRANGSFVAWLRRLARGCAAVVLVLSMAGLAGRPVAAFERSEAEWVTAIQNYLNLIRTVEATFLQVSSTGEFASGRVYIERPGRMRIEYDAPAPHLIVANRGLVTYVDRQLNQRTHLPLSATPAAILLAPSIALTDGALKITALDTDKDGAEITLVQKDNPGEGSLTLLFIDNPLTLRQWRVVDAQGIVTTVTLENAKFNVALKSDLFELP
jgi:outer membrane lipoprotein-sorting protein